MEELFPVEEIQRRFGFHPATHEVVEVYANIRRQFIELASRITATTPQGREQVLFLTALQEAQMWAIASVATNLTPLG